MSRILANAGRPAEAVDAALVVVAADPLRESAQEVLVEAHLAAGNRGEAIDTVERYRELLRRELAVEPGPRILALVSRAGRPKQPQRRRASEDRSVRL